MTLASRVIPTVLCKGRHQVKGQRFVNDRVVGHALQACRVHAARSCDEMMLLDVFATSEGRTIDTDMVKDLTQDLFIPCTVGGGIRTLEQINGLLRSGADKVLIGAAAMANPKFVYQAAARFGSQAIVVAINWPQYGAVDAMLAEEMGAGEILLNNKMRDGTMAGLDLDLIALYRFLRIPLIACGGAKSYEDIADAIAAGASAVGVGALFQFQEATPREAAQYLKRRGIEARL